MSTSAYGNKMKAILLPLVIVSKAAGQPGFSFPRRSMGAYPATRRHETSSESRTHPTTQHTVGSVNIIDAGPYPFHRPLFISLFFSSPVSSSIVVETIEEGFGLKLRPHTHKEWSIQHPIPRTKRRTCNSVRYPVG
jgi:hypothetical protein